ncbi:MAG TPA: hypothetical protein VLB67_02970 [Acidimicrobiia bacterium]|nr:hypothetical protein [Acidimicrobiia bacterium]
MSLDEHTLTAIELADTDALVRVVDGMAGRRAWDEMVVLRSHLAAAVERGRQLWGVDEHVRYRLALEAPAEVAVPVVLEGPARFTLGPLTEVVAQGNSFEEMDPHLTSPTERTIVAHERALRGERIGATVESSVFDIPLVTDWEPQYPLAEYKSDRADFPTPPAVEGEAIELPHGAARIEDEPTEEALLALVVPWTTMSNGVTDLAIVEGDAAAAIAALGVPAATGARVGLPTVLEWMAWTAASGGAHGRRRGMAAGRFLAWSAVAALVGLDWPVDPAALREAGESLEWWLWSDGTTTGWRLQLAVHDPVDGLGWAFSAADARTEGPDT